MFKLRDDDSPGPGQYSPDANKGKRAGPQYGFGTASRLQNAGRQQLPDPASYQVKDDIMRKTASSWGMGYGGKIDLSKTLADTPGPGSYEHKGTANEGKKYGIGNRTDMFKLRRDDSPGPGQYRPEAVDTKKSAQSYKWGKDNRFNGKDKVGSPGPGMYDVSKDLGGPKYGFGSGIRDGNNF